MGAREGRKQRGVHVHDAVAVGPHHLPAQDAHISREQDELDRLVIEEQRERVVELGAGRIAGGLEHHRFDPTRARPFQGGGERVVADDKDDAGTDVGILQQRPKVGAGPRGKHRDPSVH